MFTYVKLNNFRSLNDVYFDLKETKEKTKRIAAIYGENGCGKSNLIRSFSFLKSLMHSFITEKSEIKFSKILSEKEANDFPPVILEMMKRNTVSEIYNSARTIECDDNTTVEIGFEIDGREGYYQIEFNEVIVYEKLYYYTGKQSGILYEILNSEIKIPKLSSLIFKTAKIQNEFKERIEKYWGRHSMLAICYEMINSFNLEYLNENISNYLFDFINMISDTAITIKEGRGGFAFESRKKINFISDLDGGDISIENEWLLTNTEIILNDFFTQTYSDIKKVFFETKKEGKRIKYKLMLYKNINNKVRLIPVEQESTGTRQILEVLRNLFGAFCGCTVIIDEVDNGVHDLLLKVVIDSMRKYITGQLIFTTHNTSLLESLEPKMVYVINGNYDGTKEIVCLSDYKIQDHNSARVRYMKGLYGGIPFVEDVDYVEIINHLKQK